MKQKILSAIVLCGFLSSAYAELEVVVLEGLGGNDEYAALFSEQVDTISSAAASLTSADRIRVFRAGDFERDDIVEHFSTLNGRLGNEDRLILFLVGHGSFDEHEYKFNIAGPDVTDSDLLEWLDGLPASDQLVVNTSSSSGATIDRLRAADRTLIAATRSGAERHATRFGHYFAVALGDPSADLDKNSRISAAEAFQFAERQVDDFFERNGQLATEHAKLEGDGAAAFTLARLGVVRADTTDPRLRELLQERQRLNDEIDALGLRRDQMSAEAYQGELLERMLELATLEDNIEALEASGAN